MHRVGAEGEVDEPERYKVRLAVDLLCEAVAGSEAIAAKHQ